MKSKKQNLTIEQRVLRDIRENGLIKEGHKVLVAVSGGPDSVCLLHTLRNLQKELRITLHVAHLNHQLRAEESDYEADYVANLAFRLNLPTSIENRNVAEYQIKFKLSPEEAAREVRYSFLSEVAQAVGAERVAVGHTKNDQAETILLHIIRGTGTQGLRGLQPLHTTRFGGSSLTVIRPLLEISREETESYCSKFGLTPCLDSSNLSVSFLRNRVRRELIPFLESYNPEVIDSLLRAGKIARDDLDFLENEGEKAWRKTVSKRRTVQPRIRGEKASSPQETRKRLTVTGGAATRETETMEEGFIFDKPKFKCLARALQRHLLRKAINLLLGSLKDIETRHIEEILKSIDKPAGRKIVLPKRLVFSIEYDYFLLGFHPQRLSTFPELEGTYQIKVPGITQIPGWEIEAAIWKKGEITNHKLIISDKQRSGVGMEMSPTRHNSREWTACLDFARAGSTISVGAVQTGDRFEPLGMDQTKKVSRFMADARIPRSVRANILIFRSTDQIIWVAGWRIDERAKVTETTREILYLKVSQKRNKAKKRSGYSSD